MARTQHLIAAPLRRSLAFRVTRIGANLPPSGLDDSKRLRLAGSFNKNHIIMASFGIEKNCGALHAGFYFLCENYRPLAKQFYCWIMWRPRRWATCRQRSKLRILIPERRVQIASPSEDPFVRVGKYYREGSFVQPDIFVCDIPEAVLHVGSGLVCTRDFNALPDFEYRLPYYIPFGKRKPRNIKRLAGIYSAVSCCFAWNIGHWGIDCCRECIHLPRHEPKEKVTILMHESLGAVHRESLDIFCLQYFRSVFPHHLWLRLEKCIWPSVVSGRVTIYTDRVL